MILLAIHRLRTPKRKTITWTWTQRFRTSTYRAVYWTLSCPALISDLPQLLPYLPFQRIPWQLSPGFRESEVKSPPCLLTLTSHFWSVPKSSWMGSNKSPHQPRLPCLHPCSGLPGVSCHPFWHTTPDCRPCSLRVVTSTCVLLCPLPSPPPVRSDPALVCSSAYTLSPLTRPFYPTTTWFCASLVPDA